MNRLRPKATDEARDIVSRMAIAFKIAQTYSVGNEAVERAIDTLVLMIKPLLRGGERLEVDLHGDYFYVNNARVRYSVQHYMNFDFLINEFRKRGLGSIVFSGDISRKNIQAFIIAFNACLSTDMPYVTFQGVMDSIESIEIGPLKEMRSDIVTNVRRTIKKSYFDAVSNLKSVVTRVRNGQAVEVRKVRLVVNTLIDLMLLEEQMLIGMTAIKDYDDYTYYHSVNVSILSLALGMKLGLNKKRLSELGIAAFLHDIGKVNIAVEILNKGMPFSDEEWEIIRSHPAEGVKAITGSMKMDPVTVSSAIVSFEHHLNYDCSGYPSLPGSIQLDLYSNIVTIADRFDVMTSAGVYERIPRPPEEALRMLVEKAGKEVDPALLKIFIRMTGYFPIGTMVVLDTGEMGIVCRGNADMPERPVIILLLGTQNNRINNGMADLAEKGQGGNYLRTIRKTVDPYQYGINVSEYLLDASS